jgi:hypothetical protein
MIIQQYNGDIFGNPPAPLTACLVDAQYNAITGIPIGDTLCVANHVGYSSDFAMAVNMGGALGDKNWLDASNPPIVSFHVPSDPFAPCEDGLVVVPLPPDFPPVVNVTGSCGVQQLIKDVHKTNEVLNKADDCNNSPYVARANAINGGRNGFFPFIGTPNNQSGPWEWAAVPPATANCNTNSVTARTYIDTIVGYASIMACRALKLSCCTVGTEELVKEDVKLSIAPNPASSELNISVASQYLIQGIELFDMSGRMVRSMHGLSHSTAVVQRDNLPRGVYTAKVYLPQGVLARMIVFE